MREDYFLPGHYKGIVHWHETTNDTNKCIHNQQAFISLWGPNNTTSLKIRWQNWNAGLEKLNKQHFCLLVKYDPANHSHTTLIWYVVEHLGNS